MEQVEFSTTPDNLVYGGDALTALYEIHGTEGQIIERATPLARKDTGEVVKWNPTATDGSEVAARVLTEGVVIPAAGKIQAVAYISAKLNGRAIKFGSATAAQKEAAKWNLSSNGLTVI